MGGPMINTGSFADIYKHSLKVLKEENDEDEIKNL